MTYKKVAINSYIVTDIHKITISLKYVKYMKYANFNFIFFFLISIYCENINTICNTDEKTLHYVKMKFDCLLQTKS